jgi:hypothetical protein
MKQFEPLTPEQRAYRYADVCRRAAGKPSWAASATEAMIDTWRKRNAELSKTMEIHLQWEAEFEAKHG